MLSTLFWPILLGVFRGRSKRKADLGDDVLSQVGSKFQKGILRITCFYMSVYPVRRNYLNLSDTNPTVRLFPGLIVRFTHEYLCISQ
jgi:hypothetical protein